MAVALLVCKPSAEGWGGHRHDPTAKAAAEEGLKDVEGVVELHARTPAAPAHAFEACLAIPARQLHASAAGQLCLRAEPAVYDG